jgi:PAS domain S-box-containing protein
VAEADNLFQVMASRLTDYAIFMLDPQGRVVSWNAGAEHIKGYWKEEVLGLDFSAFYPPDEIVAGKPALALQAAAETGRYEDEGWRVRKDGSRYYASVVTTALRDDSGTLRGFAKVVRDVSERKAAEARASQVTRQLQMAEELANLRSWTWNSADGTFHISGDLYRMCRLQPSEFGATLDAALAFVHLEDQPALRTQLDKAARDGVPFDIHHRVPLPDGTVRVFHTRGVPLEGEAEQSKVVGFAQDVTDVKRAETELAEANASLRRLSEELLRAHDEERRHIAQELHDSTGQRLAALSMILASATQIAAAGDPRIREALWESRSLVEESLREIRTLSYLLHPHLLDEEGLLQALPWYAEGFAKRSGLPVELDLPSHWERPSKEKETALFRILQEALINVHRHSGGSKVLLRLRSDSDFLTLEVNDNGRGMPAEVIDRVNRLGGGAVGVGIMGMRARVSSLGGRLEVQSDQSGTIVRALIPVGG